MIATVLNCDREPQLNTLAFRILKEKKIIHQIIKMPNNFASPLLMRTASQTRGRTANRLIKKSQQQNILNSENNVNNSWNGNGGKRKRTRKTKRTRKAHRKN
jgi:hypothetical protein